MQNHENYSHLKGANPPSFSSLPVDLLFFFLFPLKESQRERETSYKNLFQLILVSFYRSFFPIGTSKISSLRVFISNQSLGLDRFSFLLAKDRRYLYLVLNLKFCLGLKGKWGLGHTYERRVGRRVVWKVLVNCYELGPKKNLNLWIIY